MRSTLSYDPIHYWGNLIAGADVGDVHEVGHPDMGRAFNTRAYDLRRHGLLEILRRSGHLPPPASVFEAGYGVGFYLKLWRDQGCRRVVGVDLSPRACEHNRHRFPDFDLRVGDLAALDRWDDWPELACRFGLVTAIDVLYHIVDDAAARQALDNLAQLVAPGGLLVVTEKFARGPGPAQEGAIVRRRPFRWYQEVLAGRGLVHERTVPIFWCMDPPARSGEGPVAGTLGYLAWGVMRASVKFWPRNGRAQNFFGTWAGRLGRAIDLVVVPRLVRNPNLAIAAFRKA